MILQEILLRDKERLQAGFYEAVTITHDSMTYRIFEENKDYKGGSPKPYSKEPLWFSRSQLPREAGRKTKGGKTRYFEGGYDQLKREISRKPLELNRFLKSDFSNGLRQVDDFEFHVVLEKKNYDKMQGHFKDFPKASDEERKELINNIYSAINGANRK